MNQIGIEIFKKLFFFIVFLAYNWTRLELKSNQNGCKIWVKELIIEPDWNWNYLKWRRNKLAVVLLLNQIGIEIINRTCFYNFWYTYNWTRLELKFVCEPSLFFEFKTYNWTRLELKFLATLDLLLKTNLIIEPDWNWNTAR